MAVSLSVSEASSAVRLSTAVGVIGRIVPKLLHGEADLYASIADSGTYRVADAILVLENASDSVIGTCSAMQYTSFRLEQLDKAFWPMSFTP